MKYLTQAKNYQLLKVVENRIVIEQCCAAHIVQCWQQYWTSCWAWIKPTIDHSKKDGDMLILPWSFAKSKFYLLKNG